MARRSGFTGLINTMEKEAKQRYVESRVWTIVLGIHLLIWLLPDDQRCEAYVKDVLEFACKLRVCEAVTIIPLDRTNQYTVSIEHPVLIGMRSCDT